MSSLPINDAQKNLQQLIDQVSKAGKPIIIQGERGNAVLIAEKDWAAIEETLYLLSIPGMRESIVICNYSFHSGTTNGFTF